MDFWPHTGPERVFQHLMSQKPAGFASFRRCQLAGGGVWGGCIASVWWVYGWCMGYGVWGVGVLGVWCGAGRAGNDWGVVYPITSFDNFWEKVCPPNNQLRQTLGEGEKSIREFFTKIHRTPWDTSIIYIPIIPLFEGFSTFWHVILDEKRRR